MKVILIRHGESINNAMNQQGAAICTGQQDCPLSEKGIQQAKSLMNHPLLKDVEMFYVSDLTRTVQTASYFVPEDKMMLEPRLRERSMGVLEGRKIEEIKKEPSCLAYFNQEGQFLVKVDVTAKVENGENYEDVCQRVREFLEEVKKTQASTVAFISHNITIRCLLHEICKIPLEELLQFNIDNCTPVAIEWN